MIALEMTFKFEMRISLGDANAKRSSKTNPKNQNTKIKIMIKISWLTSASKRSKTFQCVTDMFCCIVCLCDNQRIWGTYLFHVNWTLNAVTHHKLKTKKQTYKLGNWIGLQFTRSVSSNQKRKTKNKAKILTQKY